MTALDVVQVRPFVVTVPAGTTKAAPLKTRLAVEDTWVIEWVELEVPPGPLGQLGFYLASSGTPMLPFSAPGAPAYFVLNDRIVRYDMDPSVYPSDWACVAYNTGNYPHTFYVRFGLAMAPDPTPTRLAVPTIASSALAGTSAGA